jgi:hypothetical protein
MTCPQADHATCDPDDCFAAKVRYWRDNGGLNAKFQGSKPGSPRGFWHDKTIKSEQERIVAEGRARGNELVPYKSVWGQ